MKAKTLAHQYLKYLQEANLDKLLSLFTENAIVVSPVYGEMPARDFYIPPYLRILRNPFLNSTASLKKKMDVMHCYFSIIGHSATVKR